jgi:hypothetical protein
MVAACESTGGRSIDEVQQRKAKDDGTDRVTDGLDRSTDQAAHWRYERFLEERRVLEGVRGSRIGENWNWRM